MMVGRLGVSCLVGLVSGCVTNPAFDNTPPAATTGETMTAAETTGVTPTTGDDACPPGVEPTLWYPDADGDGYGDAEAMGILACTAPEGHVDDASDCNDQSADVHPDQPEQCNGYDDNCDGNIDDNLEACPPCAVGAIGDAVFWACPTTGMTFAEAELACETRSNKQAVTLASLHSEEEHLFVLDLMAQADIALQFGELNAWIGLRRIPGFEQRCTDPGPEDFEWVDGSDLIFTRWNDGEPNNAGNNCNENCGEIKIIFQARQDGWNDQPCTHNHRGYTCRAVRDSALFP